LILTGQGSTNDVTIVNDADATVMGVVTGTTTVNFAGAVTASGIVTMGSTTGATISAAGVLNINNVTDATSTTDGSLQTDGGLSVAKSAVIGDDLNLLSNSAIFKVGSDQPFTLTHLNANNTLMATANHRLAFGTANDYISGASGDGITIITEDLTVTAVDSISLNAPDGDFAVTGHVATMDFTNDLTMQTLSTTLSGRDVTLEENNSYYVVKIQGPTVTEYNGASTHAVISSLHVTPPTITNNATATVTDAATVYIHSAPNATGANNTSLLVASGKTELRGNLTVSAGISTSVKAFSTDANGDLEISDSNKVILVTNSMSAGRSITLPQASTAAGVHYLIKIALDLAGTLTIQSNANGELFIGAVTFIKTDGDMTNTSAQHVPILTATSKDGILLQATTAVGSWIDLSCDGSEWYLSGTVFSDTAPTYTDV
jgi:hypothetical protein